MVTSKKIILFIFYAFFPVIVMAQSYVGPGTVLKDTLFHRYLVSNLYGNEIHQLDDSGKVDYFIRNIRFPVGMVIVDSILYVATDSLYIKGFRLSDAKLVFNAYIPGSTLLCGLTSDRKEFLYCTDIYGNKLYQISYRDSSYKILGNIKLGSDLEYDRKNNRLLIVTYNPHSCVNEYSFEKKHIDTLFEIPVGYGTCDGLELDSFGNIYTSSWDADAITYYHPSDNYRLNILANNQNNPVYMGVDQKERKMLVPCMGNNKVNFIDLNDFFTKQEELYPTDTTESTGATGNSRTPD